MKGLAAGHNPALQPRSPCEIYKCEHIVECANNKKCCQSFYMYTTSKKIDEKNIIKRIKDKSREPNRKIYQALFGD